MIASYKRIEHYLLVSQQLFQSFGISIISIPRLRILQSFIVSTTLSRGQPAKENMSAQRTEPKLLSIFNQTGAMNIAIPKTNERSNDLNKKSKVSESDSKGQLISEWNFCVFKSPKNTDPFFDRFFSVASRLGQLKKIKALF